MLRWFDTSAYESGHRSWMCLMAPQAYFSFIAGLVFRTVNIRTCMGESGDHPDDYWSDLIKLERV